MTTTEIANSIYTACKSAGYETFFERSQSTNSAYVIVYKGSDRFKIRVSDHNEGHLRSNFIDLRPTSNFDIAMVLGSLEVN